MKIDGSCLCGRVTYEADIDPAKISICHCTDCQINSGSGFRVGTLVGKDDFRLQAFRAALAEISGGKKQKAKRVQLAFSDKTTEPIDKATTKAACGAFPGTVQTLKQINRPQRYNSIRD